MAGPHSPFDLAFTDLSAAFNAGPPDAAARLELREREWKDRGPGARGSWEEGGESGAGGRRR